MKSTPRSSYDASFKLKAIDLAIQEGNCTAARKLGVNELTVRRWRRQREELMHYKKKRQKLSEDIKPGGLNLKMSWGTGWIYREQAAEVCPLCRFDWKPKQSPAEWILTISKLGRHGVSDLWGVKTCRIRAQTTFCQPLPPEYEKKVANFHKFVETKMGENSIEPDDIINMDEVPHQCITSVIENNWPPENAVHLRSGVHGIGEKSFHLWWFLRA